MRSRLLWTIAGISATVGILMFFLYTPGAPGTPGPRQAAQEEPRAVTPHQEQTIKQSTVHNDILATDRLNRQDARQHLRAMANNSQLRKPGQIQSYAAKEQRTHPHFVQVKWFQLDSNQATDVNGKLPQLKPQDQELINHHFKKARQKLKRGEAYESPKFTVGGQPYVIVAEPSADRKIGAAALINEAVLQKVSHHQKRNLRLIPYPKEGKFRVESIHADTLRDITVKTGHDNEKASHFYENEIVVSFRNPPSEQELEAISKDIDCGKPRKLGYAYVFRSNRLDYKGLRQYFEKKWQPKYTEPHYIYLTNDLPRQSANSGTGANNSEMVNIPNDILFSEYQWNLPAIETNRGWDLSKGSEDVIIAVIDTGVDLNHTDLDGQFVEGYNVVDPEQQPMDDVGHGTHVAGIIGALVNNGEGVAGISWYNKIMPVKALDASGTGTTYAVAEGIIWATDHGAKVINMSLGNYADSQFLHEAVKYAYDRDVVLIAASGNDNTERPGFPAAYPEVLAVAATDANMNRAEYSNYGDYIDIAAPGTNIASTFPGNQYAALSGTSMASPHAAAMAGLLRSLNPELTNREVMELMTTYTIDLGNRGRDKYYGSGQIDIYEALNAAAGNSQTPVQLWPQNVINSLLEELRRLR
ncbi:S8 family serine peptidase [Paenibacillus campinasensis]|uniref:S8 family serine peptidase n=1 Tax=Paenibacillus campinasensis TaxID=66347 RepID=A0ABW9SUT9_9BACL|nr:S8 family peptidase [Paenibacillus campinasensis]MUG64619.1 S8 family serine peptidase [Paenibacillus campinasensis]